MLGITTLLGKLFGTDKALTSIVDNTAKALDKLVYTSEEKAEDKQKSITEARSMVISWLQTSQGQNLARRLIALVITTVWVMQYVTMMFLSVIAVWVNQTISIKCVESAKVIGDYAENMNGAMMLILSFYFAINQLSSIAEAAMSKFSKSPVLKE